MNKTEEQVAIKHHHEKSALFSALAYISYIFLEYPFGLYF